MNKNQKLLVVAISIIVILSYTLFVIYSPDSPFHKRAPSKQYEIAPPSQMSVPVSLYNGQNSSISQGYNQKVIVNSSAYEKYEAPNLQNVFWSFSENYTIPSWIQSGASYTSNSTVYWLKIPLSLKAKSTIFISLNFANKTLDLYSPYGNEGEAPNLSAVYGMNDNGPVVFEFYDNFADTVLNTSNWNHNASSAGLVQVHNGLTLNAPDIYQYAFIESHKYFPSSGYGTLVREDFLNLTANEGPGIYEVDGSTSNTWVIGSRSGNTGGVENSLSLGTDGHMKFYTGNPGVENSVLNMNISVHPPGVFGFQWDSTGPNIYEYYNGSLMFSAYSSDLSGKGFAISSWIETSGLASGSFSVQWISVSPGLPNGVMPTANVT